MGLVIFILCLISISNFLVLLDFGTTIIQAFVYSLPINLTVCTIIFLMYQILIEVMKSNSNK
ncbi:hypothetical protein HMI01_08330 [Halolactibacillus miurensis]|uniref:Uncharacterized protein n=1 Tax=Halolactibacillus miurensis TaxID=306541 RepID=A0ABQ0VUY0_9BACI|nr:hypothetical protein HMI01_08330 [Halolactibacillus miurensis]